MIYRLNLTEETVLSYKQYTAKELFSVINEMFVIGKEEPNSLLVAFNDKIFIFKESELEAYKEKIKTEINSLFPDFNTNLLDSESLNGFVKRLANSLEDVLIAFISKEGELDIINKRKHDLLSSSLLKKTLNTLKTKKISQHFDNIDNTDFYKPFPQKSENESLVGYHGTDSSVMNKIIGVGIVPNKETEFEYYKKDLEGRIFFSTQIEEPLGHANRKSRQKRSQNKYNNIPVIVKFVVPDKAKVIQDFDIENMTGKTNKYLGGYKKREVIKDNPLGLSKELGIYGYEGSVYKNHIIGLLVPSLESIKNRIKRNSYMNDFHFSEFVEIKKEDYEKHFEQLRKLS